MESFTLLKFWRRSAAPSSHPHQVTTLLDSTDSSDGAHDGSDADEEDDEDDGPFFDLEFDLSDDDDKGLNPVDNAGTSSVSEGDDEREEEGLRTDGVDRGLSFVLSPQAVDDPSDDSGVFFKGDLCPILPLSDDVTSPKPAQFPVSLLKPSAKLRVLISGLKKPTANEKSEKRRTRIERRQNSRRLFIKFKVEEKPFRSLFARDNSSKMNPADRYTTSAEERGLSMEAKMQRYLKKVKPLYVGALKRRPLSQLGATAETCKVAHDDTSVGTTDAELGRGNEGEPGAGIKVGFGVMCRQLGKSRSASAAVTNAPCPSAAVSRRDDSLLQQQDGIQGAILHCKRSFNESRDSDINGGLGRSASDSSHRKPTESIEKSSDGVV